MKKHINCRHMKNLFYIIAILAVFNVNLDAQIYNEIKHETMVALADEALELGDYFSAIEWYNKAYKEEKDLSVAVTIARLHYELRNYKSAERWYTRLIKRDRDSVLIEERFTLAKLLKEQGKYEQSIEEFLSFLDMTDNDSLKQLSYRELKGIKMLDSLEENIEVDVKPLNNKINSAFSEYSPMEGSDGTLYFASFLRKDIIEIEEEDDYHAKIYTTKMAENRKGKQEYEKPTELSEEINRKGFHTANLALDNRNNIMYFNRQSLGGNFVSESKIYMSKQQGGGWGPASEVEGVNGEYIAKHPAPGELYGNDVLFFVSNMAGGFGGFDLYYSTLGSDGTYSTPTNLGETINTSADEVTPFYNEGTLYFSSNGHPTIGGMDIFYATWSGSEWTTAENMGDNYNSSYDDLYLRFNESGTKGYLVSNRPYKKKRKLESETCCDDIFSFEIRDIVIDLLAKVEDENGPLIGSTMEFSDTGVDEYPETKSEPNATEYRYLLESDRSYKVVVRKDGYYPDSLTFNTAGILDDYTVEKTIVLKEIPKVAEPEPEPEPEMETLTINEPIRMNNIYYDFDDDKILQDAEIDLNLILGLMNDYPEMVIELASHTDAQGISRYNEKLSQRRADSAKSWLEQKGVNGDRIVAKGYGESVILNHCVNGKRCSDEEHRINRRTEFKILEGPETIEIKKRVTITRPAGGGQSIKSEMRFPLMEIYKQNEVPVIKFEKQTINIGEVKKGEKKELTFIFTNVGNADLKIDLVSACKCTNMQWTKEVIKPGEQGAIQAVYDSTNEKIGDLHKTLDIIANTDPIVVEAFIEGKVVE